MNVRIEVIDGEEYEISEYETGCVVKELKMTPAQKAALDAIRQKEESDVREKQALIEKTIPSIAEVEKKIDAAILSAKPVDALAVIIKDLVRAVAALGDRP